jgi:hypothetical protein
LFDLAIDVLAVLVKRDQDFGLIKSVVLELVEGGGVMLQYVDDIVFLFEDEVESYRNFKVILNIFEHMLGMKINFFKGEVCCFGEALNKID